MGFARKIGRQFVFPAMMGLGVDKLIRAFAPNSTLNVMYHGVVLKDSCFFSPRHITAQQFEQHMIYYKKNFNIVRLKDGFEDRKQSKSNSRKTITLSFDDGFKNNLDTALPILEKHQIPVTFFISSICTEEMPYRFLWSELIAGMNYFYPGEVIRIGGHEFKGMVNADHLHLVDFIKQQTPVERDRVLAELVAQYDIVKKIEGLPQEIWRLLTKDELVRFSRSPMVDIGSHGHLHYNLGLISLEEARQELVLSKEKLQAAIDKEVNMIAYPDGSYTDEVKAIAEEVGYSRQLAVNYRCESDKADRRIQNRHGISSTTTYASNMLALSRAFSKKAL